MSMIENLGCLKELPERDIADCTNFVQMVMYTGRQNEEYVATRMRLYKQQKKIHPFPYLQILTLVNMPF